MRASIVAVVGLLLINCHPSYKDTYLYQECIDKCDEDSVEYDPICSLIGKGIEISCRNQARLCIQDHGSVAGCNSEKKYRCPGECRSDMDYCLHLKHGEEWRKTCQLKYETCLDICEKNTKTQQQGVSI